MPKQHVQLTPTDRDTLTALITKGDQKALLSSPFWHHCI